MTYDDLLHKIGGFGAYQKKIYFFLCLPAISCCLHKLAGVFLLAKFDYRCQLPFENQDNVTYDLPLDIMRMSYPYDYENQKFLSSCQVFDTNFSSITTGNQTKNCDRWVFNTTDNQNSAVTEFNLVCSNALYKTMSDSMLMVGVMLGSIIFGYLSDRIGRKNIFTISVWLQGIVGFGMAFSPEYWSFTFLRVLVGASTSGLYLAAYVIGLELVSPSYRMVVGVVMQMFFSVGYFVSSALAEVFTDWRYFQLAITAPTLIYTTYHLFIPESVRWLLSNNKQDEAIKILLKVCRVNGVKMSSTDIKDALESDVEKPLAQNENLPKASFIDLFKHPVILKRSIIIMLLWFVNSSAYYGLSWSTNDLGGNTKVVFFLMGLVEFPAYTFLLLTLNRWGRKINISGFLILAGLSLLATIAVIKTDRNATVACVLIAKLAVTASYGAVYVYTAEQFPTVVRNMGLGMGSFFARIGGIVAPFINSTANIGGKGMPLVVYGGLALLVGMLSLMLPETLNMKLPETIEDLIVSSEKKYESVHLKETSKNGDAKKNSDKY